MGSLMPTREHDKSLWVYPKTAATYLDYAHPMKARLFADSAQIGQRLFHVIPGTVFEGVVNLICAEEPVSGQHSG